jgi:hypothetical protein
MMRLATLLAVTLLLTGCAGLPVVGTSSNAAPTRSEIPTATATPEAAGNAFPSDEFVDALEDARDLAGSTDVEALTSAGIRLTDFVEIEIMAALRAGDAQFDAVAQGDDDIFTHLGMLEGDVINPGDSTGPYSGFPSIDRPLSDYVQTLDALITILGN